MDGSRMKSTRVAFYIESPQRAGGAQRQLQLFLRWARPMGLEAHVLAPTEGPFVDHLRSDGVPVTIVPAPEPLLQFGKQLLKISVAKKLSIWVRCALRHSDDVARAASDLGVRVIHFNTARGILAAGNLARFRGLRSVLHVRGSFAFDGAYRLCSQFLADRIVLNAEALRADIAPLFRERCIVVHDGVEIPEERSRADSRAKIAQQFRIHLPDSEFAVVSLSSLVPFKGLHHLLDAAALLQNCTLSRPVKFLLAGSSSDPQYQTFLEQRIRELKLTNVVLLGYCSDPALLLAASDLLVLPSVDRETFEYPDGRKVFVRSNEGLPQSVLEALATGLPVIASRIAGTAEQIIHRETGLLVPQGSPTALADALREMVESDDFRTRMAEAGRRDVTTRFDARNQALRMFRFLQDTAS